MQKNINKLVHKSFVQQRDQTDCGVACLQSLVRFYGGDVSLEKLRELSGTSITGTTVLGLYQAANQLGFDAAGNEADITTLIEHGEPVILHVLIDEKLQHYVVCYGYDEQKGFVINDPTHGISYLSQEELAKIWVTKVCLTLKPNPNFVKVKQVTQSKFKWFVTLLIKDKKLLNFSLVLGIAIAVLNMATAVFSQKLIDDILPSKKLSQLVGGIALLGFLLLVRLGFNSLRSYFLTVQTKDFNNRVIQYFYINILSLPKPFFDNRKIGDLTARLNDTSRIQRVIRVFVNSFVIDVLMVITSFVFLFIYSDVIGFMALFAMPVYFFLIYSFNKRIIQSQKGVMQGYAMSESHFISSIQGIAVIKNHNKISFFDKLNQTIYGDFQNQIFDLGKLNIKISVLSGIAALVFTISIISVASYKVWIQELKLGELVAILSIIGLLIPSITNLALIAIPINEAKIAFDRMYEYTSLEKEKVSGENIEEFNSLTVKNLSFRFAGRKPLFTNLNFEVKKGDKILIS